MVNGKVIQFRRGRKTIHERHFLIELPDVKKRADAAKFSGKEVVWTSPAGKKINGKISSAHGNNGLVRAIFEKGLPGQAVTTAVEIKDASDSPKKTTKAAIKTKVNGGLIKKASSLG